MKKTILLIIAIILIFLVCLFILIFNGKIILTSSKKEEQKTPFVSYNKWLHVENTNILNEKGENCRLKGLSSHGIQWYSDVITYDNLKTLRDEWNINTFRIAMYTNSDGYISHPEEMKSKVIEITDMLIDLDMYAIIDWHTLTDNDPNIYKAESKSFFDEMSKKYSDCPNVIYEICNEPSANYVTWDDYIKPYAEEIISTIRSNSEKSLIIVGTPNWCKNLDTVADNPLQFDNILYSCHFYSGTHGDELKKEIDYALDKGICIFVSECGTSDFTGNGEIFLDEFNDWINFLDERNISWINWSFSNKDESTAILLPDFPSVSNSQDTTINIDDYLSSSGKYIKQILQKY